MGDGLHTFLGWIPWNGGWIPSFFYLVQMDSILFPYGIHMEYVHGIIITHLSHTILRVNSFHIIINSHLK